ncbi:sigma 54 modulation/S30EA ribosomal C-terminal domain-containing protein, partial [Streptomyces virginiae]|uniref:sigma 54 modulation/S30EA ribosomal C-terminal domain-containing protein n=1 Tax=Streptomyces virginiae TaxID=1961 RepID=UPI00339E9B23
YEMELVGHDFYLFVDSETKLPSVVYRRHAYDRAAQGRHHHRPAFRRPGGAEGDGAQADRRAPDPRRREAQPA